MPKSSKNKCYLIQNILALGCICRLHDVISTTGNVECASFLVGQTNVNTMAAAFKLNRIFLRINEAAPLCHIDRNKHFYELKLWQNYR